MCITAGSISEWGRGGLFAECVRGKKESISPKNEVNIGVLWVKKKPSNSLTKGSKWERHFLKSVTPQINTIKDTILKSREERDTMY